MRKFLTATAALATLAGCVAPPPAPLAQEAPVQVPLVAVPGPNKTPAQFAADDASCRANRAPIPARTGATPGPNAGVTYAPMAQGAQPAPDTPGVSYLRCMASRNNTVEPIEEPTPPPLYAYYPAYPVYAGYDYGFPVFYDGFFSLGFFVGFGGFYHHGFYGPGRFGYRGFGRDGFGYRGFDHGGFERGGFDHGGFGRGGFDHGGFDHGGFDRGGFGHDGFGGGGFRSGFGGGGFHGR